MIGKLLFNFKKFINYAFRNLEQILAFCIFFFCLFILIFFFFEMLDLFIVKFFIGFCLIIMILLWYYFILYNIIISFSFYMAMINLKLNLFNILNKFNFKLTYCQLDVSLYNIWFYFDRLIKLFFILMGLLIVFIGCCLVLRFGLFDIFNFIKMPTLLILNDDNFDYSSQNTEYKFSFFIKLKRLQEIVDQCRKNYMQVSLNPKSSIEEINLVRLEKQLAEEQLAIEISRLDSSRSESILKSRLALAYDNPLLLNRKTLQLPDPFYMKYISREISPSILDFKFEPAQNSIQVVQSTMDYAIKNWGPFNPNSLNFLNKSEINSHIFFLSKISQMKINNNPLFENLVYVPLPQAQSLKLLTLQNIADPSIKIQTTYEYSKIYITSREWRILDKDVIIYGQRFYPDSILMNKYGQIYSLQIKSPSQTENIKDITLLMSKINYASKTNAVIYTSNYDISDSMFKLISNNDNLVDSYTENNNFCQCFKNISSNEQSISNYDELLALKEETLTSLWILANNSIIFQELIEEKIIFLEYGEYLNFIGVRKTELPQFIDFVKLNNLVNFENLKICEYTIEEQLEILKSFDVKMFNSFNDIKGISQYSKLEFDNNLILFKQKYPLDINSIKLYDKE